MNAGAAYIFEKDLGGVDNWGERTILFASNANAGTTPQFGRAVAISSSGHTVIGAPFEDTQANNAGVAYICALCSQTALDVIDLLNLTSAECVGDDVVISENVTLTGDTDLQDIQYLFPLLQLHNILVVH